MKLSLAVLGVALSFAMAAPTFSHAAADAAAGRAKLCASACNRITCRDAAVQKLCGSDCAKDQVFNCVSLPSHPGASIKPFCDHGCNATTCAAPDVRELCQSRCPSADIKSCLAATTPSK